MIASSTEEDMKAGSRLWRSWTVRIDSRPSSAASTPPPAASSSEPPHADSRVAPPIVASIVLLPRRKSRRRNLATVAVRPDRSVFSVGSMSAHLEHLDQSPTPVTPRGVPYVPPRPRTSARGAIGPAGAFPRSALAGEDFFRRRSHALLLGAPATPWAPVQRGTLAHEDPVGLRQHHVMWTYLTNRDIHHPAGAVCTSSDRFCRHLHPRPPGGCVRASTNPGGGHSTPLSDKCVHATTQVETAAGPHRLVRPSVGTGSAVPHRPRIQIGRGRRHLRHEPIDERRARCLALRPFVTCVTRLSWELTVGSVGGRPDSTAIGVHRARRTPPHVISRHD